MKKSISQRIKITKKNKIRRRATTLGHSRSNKSSKQLMRKKKGRSFNESKKMIKKYL